MSCWLAIGNDGDDGNQLVVYGVGTTQAEARQDVRARLGDHADLDALEYLISMNDVAVGTRVIDARGPR